MNTIVRPGTDFPTQLPRTSIHIVSLFDINELFFGATPVGFGLPQRIPDDHGVHDDVYARHPLVNRANTVVFIKHNLEIIKNADWIVDLEPERGGEGGRIVAEGTPEMVAKAKNSYTGQFLHRELTLA